MPAVHENVFKIKMSVIILLRPSNSFFVLCQRQGFHSFFPPQKTKRFTRIKHVVLWRKHPGFPSEMRFVGVFSNQTEDLSFQKCGHTEHHVLWTQEK